MCVCVRQYQAPNGDEFGATNVKALDQQLSKLCKALPPLAEVFVISKLASGYIGGVSFIYASKDPSDGSHCKVKSAVGGPAQSVPRAAIQDYRKPELRYGVLSLDRCLPITPQNPEPNMFPT